METSNRDETSSVVDALTRALPESEPSLTVSGGREAKAVREPVNRETRKTASEWRVTQRMACAVVRPVLLERRVHVETEEVRYVPVREGESYAFQSSLGFVNVLGIQVMSFLLMFFLPRVHGMAERVIQLTNETLRRLEYVTETDEQGLPVIKTKVRHVNSTETETETDVQK